MNAPAHKSLGLEPPNFVNNTHLIAWVSEMAALCKPQDIVWCDGSDEEYTRLCDLLVSPL